MVRVLVNMRLSSWCSRRSPETVDLHAAACRGAASRVCAGAVANIAAAAALAGSCAAAGGVIVLLTLPLRTYPVVTSIPFRSASAQLKGETAAPLMPLIL